MPSTVHSRPVFEKKLVLQSTQAQQIIKRSFKRTINVLYRLDVIVHVTQDEKVIAALEHVITKKLSHVKVSLDTAFTEINEQLTRLGITSIPQYTHAQTISVNVSTPHIGRYAELISTLDKLVVAIDTLWLAGELENKVRMDNNFTYQRQLVDLSRDLYELDAGVHQHVETTSDVEHQTDTNESTSIDELSEV